VSPHSLDWLEGGGGKGGGGGGGGKGGLEGGGLSFDDVFQETSAQKSSVIPRRARPGLAGQGEPAKAPVEEVCFSRLLLALLGLDLLLALARGLNSPRILGTGLW
jgi:hypothetical protein